ncbi:hypothetical protein ANO11243_077600 [Dothideomycetidae sp. 11243]|nr:hypothetical protein ANO11243_077600 [fungal sp. No.11243]
MASSEPPALSPLSFPPATFAKLTPGPFLLAHLQPSNPKTPPTRPSGRSLLETRKPTVQTGSLSHSNGSAVVRIGGTAVVVGVRAEILRAQDIPHLSSPDIEDEISSLGLLVPNLELSTGSSPQNLPGNAPSSLAQSLTHRLQSQLHSTRLVRGEDLRIEAEEEDEDGNMKKVVKAYWALHIDALLISADGCVFDAAWAAVRAALADTRLPGARWDADRENVVCSARRADARKLELSATRPIAASFAAFSTQSKVRGEDGRAWILADPDAFEDGVCSESITVTVGAKGQILRVEKSGGLVIGVDETETLIEEAQHRWAEWDMALLQARAD